MKTLNRSTAVRIMSSDQQRRTVWRKQAGSSSWQFETTRRVWTISGRAPR